MNTTFLTKGRQFQQHFEIPFGWRHDSGSEVSLTESPCFAIALVRGGSAMLAFDKLAVPVAAPALVILDEVTRPAFRNAHALQLSTLYFNPSYINNAFDYAQLHAEPGQPRLAGSTKQDYFLLERFVKLVDAQRIFAIPPHLTERIINLFDTTIAEADKQPDKFWPCRTRSFLIELLFQLRLLQTDEAPALHLPPDTDDARSKRINRALTYVQECFQQEITLGDLARTCATNRTTLNEEFRSATGMTVRAYTIALRMKMAAALLRDTRIPVTEVMTRVGYENQSHFTRAFRQTLGDAPRAYRDKYCIL